MTIHTKAAATAVRLLAKYGQVVTLTHSAPGTYDPATGSVANTLTTQTAVAVELDYSEREIDGTLVQRGDKKLLLAASGLTVPTVDDTVTVRSVVYTIKSVNTVAPGGVDIVYELQGRA